MKIVSFRAGGVESFGVVNGDGVVDGGGRLGLPTLRAALEAGRLDELRAFVSAAPDHALSAIEFLPVIPSPEKIMCVGLNYRLHVEESGGAFPPNPLIFMRTARSQVGHLQSLMRPRESERYDYEGELALVIGKAGRRIAPEKALGHVAGYACYNEGSVRDWQRHSTQYTGAKNFERSGAFGPWMVTADEIPDPTRLRLTTRLNGEVMQDSPTSDLIFDIPFLINYISTFTTLAPGDVIVTGTPSGVGDARTPPVYMKKGDTVEIEISGIGVLRNPVEDD